MLKIELPNQDFLYVTEDSKECDKDTAFVLTAQNEKYLQKSTTPFLSLTLTNALFITNLDINYFEILSNLSLDNGKLQKIHLKISTCTS